MENYIACNGQAEDGIISAFIIPSTKELMIVFDTEKDADKYCNNLTSNNIKYRRRDTCKITLAIA